MNDVVKFLKDDTKHDKINRSSNDGYEDLANAVVYMALRDYCRGERMIQNGETFENTRSYKKREVLRNYYSANAFLHSDRLEMFTKLDPEYLIEMARKYKITERPGLY